jgi:hypothetical protein
MKMRMKDLTDKMQLAVPCPTCGVSAGMGCLLHAGGLRNEPHLDRKLAAIEWHRDSLQRRKTSPPV